MAIAISCIGILSFFPTNVVYADGSHKCGNIETSIISCEEEGIDAVFHILNLAIDILTAGIGIFAVVGISIAGIQYLTAGGNEQQVEKAKRRIFEIVIGMVCYAILWVFLEWLLPGGKLNIAITDDNGNTTVSYDNTATVGQTFRPQASLPTDVTDKTYSLISDDDTIAKTIGANAKCIAPGETTLTIVSASGKQASMPIKCVSGEDASGGHEPGSSSNGQLAVDKSPTTGSMVNTKYHGHTSVRSETSNIIKQHNKDFYYNNYSQVINQYGGYNGYVKSLGGVFSNLNGYQKIPISTAADLQAASEYMFGLWMIWGPDYGNGKKHVSWSGKDAFYKGLSNRSSTFSYTSDSINKMLESSKNVRTCCNIAFNSFSNSVSLGDWHNKGGSRITKWTDLKVGDMINFFNASGRWNHVVMVGEVYEDYLVVYDGGSRFMMNRNYKYKIPRKKDGKLRSPYNGYGSWYGFRPWTIDQNITLAGLNG